MVSSKKHSSAKTNKSLSGKDKVSDAREYGEGLVGSRIRVWWPLDRQFYEGVVESYAPSQRKHRVLYDDGDVENLIMKKETWQFIEEADEISLQDQSSDESSDATPEALDRKRLRSNGKSSEKGRTDDALSKKKQKIDSSAKSKSKASSKKSEDGEGEKGKMGVNKAETSKDAEKQTLKPDIEKNGKMGDIGGKIVAAASRMSGRFRSKENGQEKEAAKSLKSSKKGSESKNLRQKRPSSSSEDVSEKVKKPKTSLKEVKSSDSDDESGDDDDTPDDDPKPKSLKSSKKVSESMNPKQKGHSSSSAAVSEKVKKPRTSSKEVKSNNSDEDDDSSDDESEPLVSFLKKLKGKKAKEAGEGISGNEAEAVEESS